MQTKINFKELIKGILVIGLYFVLPYIISIPFLFIKNRENYISFYYIYMYLVLAIIFILIYRKDIEKNFKDMKVNYKSHLKLGYSNWGKGLFVMIISSIFMTQLGIGENINQQDNMNLLEQMPVIEFTLAVIFAPIIEELVFRKSLSKAFTNKHLYAYITGLIFGFLHVYTSLSDISKILYLIPYSALGVAFGYTYKETDNILTTMIVHATHNAMALTISLILGGLV